MCFQEKNSWYNLRYKIQSLQNIIFKYPLLNFTAGVKQQNKAIPLTGRGDPLGCETSRLPHFLENRLTDGGEFVKLTRRSHFAPGKIPRNNLYLSLIRSQGHSEAWKIWYI
jgi:hypothetical protein